MAKNRKYTKTTTLKLVEEIRIKSWKVVNNETIKKLHENKHLKEKNWTYKNIYKNYEFLKIILFTDESN